MENLIFANDRFWLKAEIKSKGLVHMQLNEKI